MNANKFVAMLGVALGATILVHRTSVGQVFDPYKNPDAFIAAFTTKSEGRIKELIAVAKGSGAAAAKERLQAMVNLRDEFPDVALPTLVELLNDDNAEVAGKAAELIADASMMMNHRVYGDPGEHSDNPVEAYMMAKHELIFSALRDAVKDQRSEVHTPAAKVLASQSDERGLALMSESRQLYGDDRYVEIMSLASPESSGQYIQEYLDSSDPKIRTLVGSCLIQTPAYAAAAKEKILFNAEAPLESRIEVAKHVYDAKELLPLVASPETPPALYSEVMSAYVNRSAEEITPNEIQRLLEGVRSRNENNEGLKKIEGRLNQLYDEKSSKESEKPSEGPK